MEFQNYLEEHIKFILILSFYFLPALVGAALTTYVKYADKCDKSKRCTTKTIITMFFSALVPAIILTSVNDYLNEILQASSLRIGIAFVFGCVGDEILEIVTSLKKMVNITKALAKHIESLKKISAAANDVMDEINKDETNNDDDHKPHGGGSNGSDEMFFSFDGDDSNDNFFTR